METLKVLTLVVLLISAIWDLSFRRVPNCFSCAFFLIGFIFQVFLFHSYMAFLYSFVIFFVGLILWRHNFIGAADVKLAASFSLLLPSFRIFDFLIDMFLAGGIVALVYIVLSRTMKVPKPSNRKISFMIRIYTVAKWRLVRNAPLPYAVAIAISGIITLWT